jgi:hypothetical protein
VFDVDPGDGPGQTSITFQWFSVSTTVPAPTAPLEKFVFARLPAIAVSQRLRRGLLTVTVRLPKGATGPVNIIVWRGHGSERIALVKRRLAVHHNVATFRLTFTAADRRSRDLSITASARHVRSTSVAIKR